MAGSGSQQLGRVGALRGARELLGVTADAEVRDLRRAYRRRARGLHPDRSADPEATQQFQALHAAYRLALAAALASTPPGTPPGTAPGTAPATDPPAARGSSRPASVPTSGPRRVRLRAGGSAAGPDAFDGVTGAADDGVWVVAGPVHVQPPRHAPMSRNPAEGRP